MAPRINGDNFFTQIFGTKKAKTEKADKYFTVSMTNKTTDTKNVSYKKLLGLDLHTSAPVAKQEAVFSDADLDAFVQQYATNISDETAENVRESMAAITSVDLATLDAIPEEYQDAYMGQQVDGTADRVKNDNQTRLFSSDIDNAVNGDPQLLDIAGYIFNDAAERQAA